MPKSSIASSTASTSVGYTHVLSIILLGWRLANLRTTLFRKPPSVLPIHKEITHVSASYRKTAYTTATYNSNEICDPNPPLPALKKTTPTSFAPSWGFVPLPEIHHPIPTGSWWGILRKDKLLGGDRRRWAPLMFPPSTPLPPVGGVSVPPPIIIGLLRGTGNWDPAARRTCCIWGIGGRDGSLHPGSQLCPACGSAKI